MGVFKSIPSYLLFTDDCNLIFHEVVIRFMLRQEDSIFLSGVEKFVYACFICLENSSWEILHIVCDSFLL